MHKFIKFYLQIFKAKEYEVEAQTIWFKERGSKKGNKASSGLIKRKWNLKEILINPALDESVLYGVEMKLKGNCAYLFLKDEIGNHRWNMSSTEDFTFVVEVSEDMRETPSKINRKDFYKGNPRRVFKNGHFKDPRLKINREVSKNQFSEIVLEILNERFKIHLNKELI